MPQRKHQVPEPEAPKRRWVTQSAIAAHLGVTTRTVRDMTADGRLTGYRLNKNFVRYDLNEVDRALTPFGGAATEPSAPVARGRQRRSLRGQLPRGPAEQNAPPAHELERRSRHELAGRPEPGTPALSHRPS
jgi:hypothetical protein